MKTIRKNWNRLTVGLAAGMLALLLWIGSAWATPPGLSITLTATNQVSLLVTNGLPTATYEIYFQEFLDNTPLTNGTWQLVATGVTGQTNFGFTLGDTDTGFFRAVNGNDFDMDGIPNFEDARPFNSAIGLMTVTIETPANSSNVQ